MIFIFISSQNLDTWSKCFFLICPLILIDEIQGFIENILKFHIYNLIMVKHNNKKEETMCMTLTICYCMCRKYH